MTQTGCLIPIGYLVTDIAAEVACALLREQPADASPNPIGAVARAAAPDAATPRRKRMAK